MSTFFPVGFVERCPGKITYSLTARGEPCSSRKAKSNAKGIKTRRNGNEAEETRRCADNKIIIITEFSRLGEVDSIAKQNAQYLNAK